MIRPERVGVEAHGATGENRLPGMVEHSVYLGSFRELHVRLMGGDLVRRSCRTTACPTHTNRARR